MNSTLVLQGGDVTWLAVAMAMAVAVAMVMVVVVVVVMPRAVVAQVAVHAQH